MEFFRITKRAIKEKEMEVLSSSFGQIYCENIGQQQMQGKKRCKKIYIVNHSFHVFLCALIQPCDLWYFEARHFCISSNEMAIHSSENGVYSLKILQLPKRRYNFVRNFQPNSTQILVSQMQFLLSK